MTERGFDTGFWTEGFTQKQPKDGKLLLAYLKTNEHCNPAGVYHITLSTMAFDTKIAEQDLSALLEGLRPVVGWYPDAELVWVKDFIKEQTKSPKFLAAAAKSLLGVGNNELVRAVIQYNLSKYSISIPYQYYMDKVSVLTRASGASASADAGAEAEKEEEVGQGKEKTGVAPKGAGLVHQAEGDAVILEVWRAVAGWKMKPEAELELLAKLRNEFPELDLLAQSKKWAARKLSEPLTAKSRPSQQVWNWMEVAQRIERERREREQSKGQGARGQRAGTRPAKDFRGKW